MSLSEQNRAAVWRVLPGNTSITNFMDFRCGFADLEALLNSVREAAYKEGWNDREDDLIAGVNRIAPARAEGVADLLKDPNVVHINMLRGGIAKLSPAQIGHLYRGDEAAEVIREVARQNPEAEGVAALQQAAVEALRQISALEPETMLSAYTDRYSGERCAYSTLDYYQVQEIVAAALSPLPQQTALVDYKGLGPHEPAACGEGTLPSPSVPPRSTGGAMGHLGNVLQLFAELDPGDRCRAFDNAMDFYNEHNPERRVEGVPGFVTHLTIESPLTRSDGGEG